MAFFIISITMLFGGCGSTQNNEEIIKKIQTKFTLPTTNSTNVTIETKDNLIDVQEHKGKVVLINFWATWCVVCKAELPHLVDLQKSYKDKFEIIAVNMGNTDGTFQTNEELKSFMVENEMNFTVTNSTENFKLADAMGGIRSIPTMFMVNPEGKIIQKYVGIVPEEMMEMDIKNALGKI